MNTMYVLTPTLAFEIAEKDLPEKMEWLDAITSGTRMDERWRLPTKEELDEMYRLHQRAIGEFKFEMYWSSKGHSNRFSTAKSFKTGDFYDSGSSKDELRKYNVRLVRNI